MANVQECLGLVTEVAPLPCPWQLDDERRDVESVMSERIDRHAVSSLGRSRNRRPLCSRTEETRSRRVGEGGGEWEG